jgi:hypothetical protein
MLCKVGGLIFSIALIAQSAVITDTIASTDLPKSYTLDENATEDSLNITLTDFTWLVPTRLRLSEPDSSALSDEVCFFNNANKAQIVFFSDTEGDTPGVCSVPFTRFPSFKEDGSTFSAILPTNQAFSIGVIVASDPSPVTIVSSDRLALTKIAGGGDSQFVAIPEPDAAVLFATGLVGLICSRFWRKAK